MLKYGKDRMLMRGCGVNVKNGTLQTSLVCERLITAEVSSSNRCSCCSTCCAAQAKFYCEFL